MKTYFHNIGKVLAVLPLALLGTYITAWIVSPENAQAFTIYLFEFYNYLIAKVISGFSLAYLLLRYRKSMTKWITNKIIWTIEDVTEIFFPVHRDSNELEGIPHSELLHHLFTERSFKRNDIEDKFLIPRYKVQELGESLERVNVLVRGENNSRVLNDDLSRADVSEIIRNAQTHKDLKPLFRKKGSSYTSLPSAKAIEKEIEEMATCSHATDVQPVRNRCATGMQPLTLPSGFTTRTLTSV